MSVWLNKISGNPTDFTLILGAYDYYENEYEDYRKELQVKGANIIAVSSKLPGLTEVVTAKWCELKAIVSYLEALQRRVVQKYRKMYTENYNRELAANVIERYCDSEAEVFEIGELVIRMKMILDKWDGVAEGLKQLSYQIKTISEIRQAGLDEITI